jgi:hypothetical protein
MAYTTRALKAEADAADPAKKLILPPRRSGPKAGDMIVDGRKEVTF